MLLFKTSYSYLYHKKKNPSSIKIYQPKTLLAEKKNPSRNNHLYLNISKPIKKILISFSQ